MRARRRAEEQAEAETAARYQADLDALPALQAACDQASAEVETVGAALFHHLDQERADRKRGVARDPERWKVIERAVAESCDRHARAYDAIEPVQRRVWAYRDRMQQRDIERTQNVVRVLERLFGARAEAPAPPPSTGPAAAGYRASIDALSGGAGYRAIVPALPGLEGRASRATTALRRLEAAIPGYLAALRATGQPIPEPDAARESTDDR